MTHKTACHILSKAFLKSNGDIDDSTYFPDAEGTFRNSGRAIGCIFLGSLKLWWHP